MFIWSLLSLGAMIGGSVHFVRKLEVRATGDKGPEPRDWVLRKPEPNSLYLRADQLERDYWKKNRRELNIDVWAGERYEIDAHIPRPVIQPNPRRKKFILETLDASESLYKFREGRDIVRPKFNPNAGTTRRGKRMPSGRIEPVDASQLTE